MAPLTVHFLISLMLVVNAVSSTAQLKTFRPVDMIAERFWVRYKNRKGNEGLGLDKSYPMQGAVEQHSKVVTKEQSKIQYN